MDKREAISFITESYQKFLANLEYVNVDKKFKVIQITSSVSGEGKSTFLSNVAYLLGQKKQKTILLDLDLRKPKVHFIYDVENKDGITDILADRISIEDAIKSNPEMGFDAITSGEKTTAIVNLLESKKINDLIDYLKNKYDYILIDSPPLINVSDALYISKLSDAVVFAISLNKTKKALVKEAKNLIRLNNINVIGIILTQVDLKKNRYKYGYGYGYGYDNSYEESND